jgi:hypothetical protein
MTNNELANLLVADTTRIVDAITTGAAWEIWMQVELIIILRQNGKQAAREVQYGDASNLYLDALVRDQNEAYAIELKVESANNSGIALLTAMQADIAKIKGYPAASVNGRWVVSMAYSGDAKKALQTFSATPANNAVYAELNSVGVLVATV